MAVDWLAIRNDYINGGGSYRKLAEKYGITLATLRVQAERENWPDLKKDQQHKTSTKTAQKTQEKISEALSEEAAAKSRIRLKLIQMAENWVESQCGAVNDPADYRRMVQSCLDMGVFDESVRMPGQTREDDPLTKALKELAEGINDADQ